jgi:hypothetical protein
MTAISVEVIKNTNLESVIKCTGTGSISILLSSLISSCQKNCRTTSGDNFVTLNSDADIVGIVVGGTITGTGIPANTLVTDIKPKKITLDKTVTATNSIVSLNFESQVLIDPELIITKIYFSTFTGIILKSSSTDSIVQLNGTGHWCLNNMAIVDGITTEVIVETTADDTAIIAFKKQGNWGNDNYSYGNA